MPFLALTGFMGSGKSAAGRELATRLHLRFIDLDDEIEAIADTTIQNLFATRGEDEFRRLELAALRSVAEWAQEAGRRSGKRLEAIVALGGGTVTIPEARALLRECGHTVWLQVEVAEAWRRVAGSGRPLAGDVAAFERLFMERRAAYLAAADWSLDTSGLDVEQLVSRLELLVNSTLGVDAEGDASEDGRPAKWSMDVAGTQRKSRIWGGCGSRYRLSTWLRDHVQAGRQVVIVTDEGVAEAWRRDLSYLARLVGDNRDPLVVLPAGETTKSADNLFFLWERLAAQGLHRDDVLVVVGGGVMGDLGGFAAATYLRGIQLWQIPTSVIAQVDSSVGGKVAVNMPQGKNLVGTFYQPDRVLVDPCLLTTLPQVQLQNGLGEVVKYALLLGGNAFTDLQRKAAALLVPDPVTWSLVAKRCIDYKNAVVVRDELDRGERAVLNLGHTTAHALERTAGYGRLGHGTAVALGLLVALRVSEDLLGCSTLVREKTVELLSGLGLPTQMVLPETEVLMAAMNFDKKADAGGVNFVGLKSLGSPVVRLQVPEETLQTALKVIKA